jgi:hypothetical protein
MCVMQPDREQLPIHLEDAGTIGEVETVPGQPILLPKLQQQLIKTAKLQKTHLRKEQISQGVLKPLLRSLGRIILEQVCACVSIYRF